MRADRRRARRGRRRRHRGRPRRRPRRRQSLNYGPARHTDWEWIEAAAASVTPRQAHHPAAARHRHHRTTCKRAHDLGVRSVRVATHCTEADVSAQHIATARELGMDVVRLPDDEPHGRRPRSWPQQAKLMESYGAHCVYVTDSGGRLTMDGVARAGPRLPRRARPGHRDRHPRPPQPVARASPTRVVAVEDGATRVDASLAGHRRRRRQLPARGVRRRRRPASAGSTAATCSRCRTPPTTSSARCRTARSGSTARRSRSATPASTPASCATPRRAAARYGVDARDILRRARPPQAWSAARRT